jgi:hypothetical protein
MESESQIGFPRSARFSWTMEASCWHPQKLPFASLPFLMTWNFWIKSLHLGEIFNAMQTLLAIVLKTWIYFMFFLYAFFASFFFAGVFSLRLDSWEIYLWTTHCFFLTCHDRKFCWVEWQRIRRLPCPHAWLHVWSWLTWSRRKLIIMDVSATPSC